VEDNMLGNLKDNKGFTMIELLMVFLVLGILSQMAWTFMIDLRKRSFDVTAVVDGRNLIMVVRNSFVTLEDVDYTTISGTNMGIKTTGGIERVPAFTFSHGVRAVVTAGSGSTGIPDNSFFEAYLYHENGSPDPFSVTGSGKKEYYYLADETTDPPIYSSPPKL
jgi:prepilin-type N-terminal cleavage/methylation domain-containing protein